MGIGLSMVKWEGAISSAICALSLLIFSRGLKIKKNDALLIGLCFGSLMVPIGWIQWLKLNGHAVSIHHLRQDISLENMKAIFYVAKNYIFSSRLLILLAVLAAHLLLVRNHRAWSYAEKFLLFVLLGHFLFSITAGLKWPVEEIYSYYNEAFARLFLRVTPAILLLWASRALRKEVVT